MTEILKLIEISRDFDGYQAVKHASFSVNPGEVVALIGKSGSGKTTIMQIAGLLDKPSSGRVIINGQDCTGMNDESRTKIRRNNLGFIYQFHYLLQELSIIENIMLPQLLIGKTRKIAKSNALSVLQRVQLKHKMDAEIFELSGGERQRIAIARGMVNTPSVILADEPTGNLDPETSDEIFNVFLECARKHNIAVLLVTHNHKIAARSDKILEIVNGVLKIN